MRAIKLNINSSSNNQEYKPITTTYFQGRNSWVDYGKNNLLPDEILSLTDSPTHKSLLDLKALLTAGNGFLFDETNTKLKEYIDEYDLNEVLNRVSKEQSRFNGFSLQLIPSLNGSAIIKHLDFSKLRAKNEDIPHSYFLSLNWKDYRRSPFQPKEYPAYILGESNIQDITDINIVYNYDYCEGNYFYPRPDYSDCIYYIRLESELSKFQFNNVCNGLVSTGIFTFFDQGTTDEERNETIQNIKNDLTGADNGGSLIALWVKGEKAPTYIPLQTNNNADIYDNLIKTCEQKICSGHRLNSKSLAGLGSDGSIFTNEISTAFEYFSNTVIRNYQKSIIKVFTRLFRDLNLITRDEVIGIKSLNPIQFIYDNNTLNSIMTINELRNRVGLPDIADGDVTPNSVNKSNSINITTPPAENKNGIVPGASNITKGEPKSLA